MGSIFGTMEYGPRTTSAGSPSSLGLGVGGWSDSNFRASPADCPCKSCLLVVGCTCRDYKHDNFLQGLRELLSSWVRSVQGILGSLLRKS